MTARVGECLCFCLGIAVLGCGDGGDSPVDSTEDGGASGAESETLGVEPCDNVVLESDCDTSLRPIV